MKIISTETIIDSDWTNPHNNLDKPTNDVFLRICWLRHNYLKEIFVNGGEVLYQDPEDSRYWELTYPKSYMHGYGPPLLRYLTDEEAVTKYKISPQYIDD